MRTRCIHVTIGVLALLCASSAHGQDRPTVFQHGFSSNGDTWREAAVHLQARVMIVPHVPTTDWWRSFDEQAQQLHALLPNLAMPPVVVGHSNGGLVARTWSRSRPLEGIVTLGTPNQGAPLLLNGSWLGRYYGSVAPRIVNIATAFAPAFDEWNWIGSAVWPAAMFARAAAGTAVRVIEETVPVLPQIVPGSTFLSELNSAASVSREGANVVHRVGIVAWDHNHYKGGPFRLVRPAVGEGVHDGMQAAVGGLLIYAGWLLGDTMYDPYDPDKYFRAMERALAIQDLAAWLLDFNPAWCIAISSVGTPRCAASDALVPFDSQYYPGAETLLYPNGPVHTMQTTESDAKLYEALTDKVHLTPRPGGS